MHRAPAQDGGDGGEILERRVDRAADAHLPRRRPGRLAHRDDVARRRGQRDQRLELAEVDRLLPRRRRRPGRRPARRTRPPAPGRRATPRPLVAGEDPGRRAGLHDHVADRPAVGRAQPGDAVPVELEDPARGRRARRAGAAARARRPSTAPTGRSAPRSSTPTTSGRSTAYGRPAIATATSVAPAPIASMPSAPAMVVWLSAPTSTRPAARTARGGGSARSRSPAASRARRSAPPSCAGTRGPRDSCCRTGGRCGRRRRRSGRRPGRGRAARTGGRPSSRSRPRAGSGRRGARSPRPSRRPGGRR